MMKPYINDKMNDQTDAQNLNNLTPDTVAQMVIEELLTRWPQTAVLFQQHNMACVGCAVASFYTVAEAASVYGLPPQPFIAELMAIIEQAAASSA